MRRLWPALVFLPVLGGAWLAGARNSEEPSAPRRRAAPAAAPAAAPEPDPPAAPEPLPKRDPVDVRSSLRRIEDGSLDRIEEEFEARVIEDPAFAEALFEAFLAETDPVRLSFLQNVLASHPPLRNDPAWQSRFMKVAESDARTERRVSACVFLQQAEAVRAVRERLHALAENDRELLPHALAALKGLPDRRPADPRLAELAGRIADRDPDPFLRGLALRIGGDPARAARALGDPDRTVRLQACRVAVSRADLEAALRRETDPEVTEMLELRLSELP
jgi:hypothetical protein